MITNIRQSDDAVFLTILGHPNVIERPKRQFYSLSLPFAKDQTLLEQNNLERIKIHFEAFQVERLSKTRILLVSPNLSIDYLTPIEPNYLWPYFTLVAGGNPERSNFSNDTFTWSVGERQPFVLTWGLIMNYQTTVPSIKGLYYGYRRNGKITVELYDEETMRTGLIEFQSAVRDADIVVTSDLQMIKLSSLKIWANENDVSFDTDIFKRPLLTSLRELLNVEIPSLNWDYPDQIHAWAVSKRFTSTKRTFLHDWENDYVRTCVQNIVNLSTVEHYTARLEFWNAIAHYLLFKRAELAIDSGLDLRTVLSVPEMQSCMFHIYSTCVRSAPPCTVLAESLSSTLHSLSEVAVPQIERLYVYDARDICNKYCPPDRGTRRIVIDTFVRSVEFVERLKNVHGAVGLFELGYVSFAKIDGIDPIFQGSAAAISLMGIVIYSEADGFGYGVQGSEKVHARTFDIRALECLGVKSRRDAPTRLEDVAYVILVTPKNYHLYRKMCTLAESDAISRKSICVPLMLWKTRDGMWTIDTTAEISRKYIGPGLPSSKEIEPANRFVGMRWE